MIESQPTPTHAPRGRAFLGDDAAKPASALTPIIERVGVPLLWMGIGYMLCKMTSKGKTA